MDGTSVLTGGGSAALLLAIVYVGRLALDWWRERTGAPRSETIGAVTDATAANSILLASLHETQERELQLSGQVEELRAQNSLLYDQMRKQRRDHDREMASLRIEYEGKLAKLQEQVDDFSHQLTDLRQQMRPDPS